MIKQLPNVTVGRKVINPYDIIVVAIQSVETGERGFYIGEPMLLMADGTLLETPITVATSEAVVTVSGETPVGMLLNDLRARTVAT